MARKATTPEQAQRLARQHVKDARKAAEDIGRIIDGRDGLNDEQRAETLHAAALALEKAGCYVRRANGNRLLIP